MDKYSLPGTGYNAQEEYIRYGMNSGGECSHRYVEPSVGAATWIGTPYGVQMECGLPKAVVPNRPADDLP
jgi:hypothetical protein